MKKSFLFIFIFNTLMSQFNIFAQENTEQKAIINELNSRVFGKGHVTIYEDEVIKNLVGRPIAPSHTIYSTGDGSQHYIKMRGFKIQAFAGNDQRSSKNEAYHKQKLINSSYPDQETVVLFDAPFWRLRVGNFKTREEAQEMLKNMQKTFSNFGKEMYIVMDEVKIPVDY